MTVEKIHLVRHGEVENPKGIIYGRLPGFHLSERGQRQAAAAAQHLTAHIGDGVRRPAAVGARVSTAPCPPPKQNDSTTK